MRNEFMPSDGRKELGTLVLFVVALLVLSMLMGCKRLENVTRSELHGSYAHRTDTAHVYHKDSIVLRDSVFTTVYTKGDTVYNVSRYYRYDTKWQDRVSYEQHTDTLVLVDSVRVSVPVVTEKKVVAGWAWTVMLSEALAVGAIIAVWWYRRKH